MLDIDIAGIKLRNPLILASGVVGSDTSMYIRAWRGGVGAVVTKTFTVEKREGYSTPIITALRCGYLNAVGLANPGKDGIRPTVETLKSEGIPTIVSIAGSRIDDFLLLASIAYDAGADAVELNLSCPHTQNLGLEVGLDRDFVMRVIRKIKEEVGIKVFPKFGFEPRVIETTKLAEIAGADAVVLMNTIRAMKIDIWVGKPILSNRFGGLSGPAIHPIAVGLVYQAYEHLEIPIIASGGVWSWEDIVEFILAGAKGVQIGSVLAEKGYEFFQEALERVKNFLAKKGYKHIEDIVGLAHQ